MTNAEQHAVKLYDLLKNAGPSDIEQIQKLVNTIVPPDEIERYNTEIRHIQERLRNSGIYDISDVSYGAPEWLMLSMLSLLLNWIEGNVRTCVHSPSPRSANVITAAAWKPNTIVCPDCSHILKLRDGSVKDRTCDHCGSVNDTIVPGTAQFGLLLYSYGLCHDCHALMEGSNDGTT